MATMPRSWRRRSIKPTPSPNAWRASRSFEHLDAEQLYSDRPGTEDRSVEGRVAQPERRPQSVETAARPERPGSGRGDPDRLRELSRAAGKRTGPAAEAARHVSGLLQRLASADAATRGKAAAALVPPLVHDLDRSARASRPRWCRSRRCRRIWSGMGIAGRQGPRSGDPEG